jgi:hypothetical protein
VCPAAPVKTVVFVFFGGFLDDFFFFTYFLVLLLLTVRLGGRKPLCSVLVRYLPLRHRSGVDNSVRSLVCSVCRKRERELEN